MAQTGLHSLIAAGISEKLYSPELRRRMAWGLLLGSVLPDIDILPASIAYLITGRFPVIYEIHRTFTHSFAGILVTLGIFLLLSQFKGRKWFYTGLGASLGVLLHIVGDVFWWGPVDVLWPLGYFGVHSSITLLANYPLTPMAAKLLGAGEFLMYALYFSLLTYLAGKKRIDVHFLPFLRKVIKIEYAFFAVFFILAFFLSRQTFEILLYVLLILVFFPLFIYVVARMKNTIEG